MNEKLRQEIKKELTMDPVLTKEGKWVRLGNTKLEFLVRPATAHNKEFQKILLQDENYKIFDTLRANPDALKEEPGLIKKAASIILGTIILDIRKDGVSKEELGSLEVDDLVWIMQDFETDFVSVLMHSMNRKNFTAITDEQEKN